MKSCEVLMSNMTICGCGCGATSGCIERWRSVFDDTSEIQCVCNNIKHHNLDDEIERLHTQLAGISCAATNADQRVVEGAYGWTPTYDDVLTLRLRYDELLTIIEALCPYVLDVRKKDE